MEPQIDLLQELDQELALKYASVVQRFVNFIIDGVVVNLITSIPTLYFMYFSQAPNNSSIGVGSEALISLLMNSLLSLVVYVCYYIIYEGITKGKTLGKLVTFTRAVKENGEDITWEDAVYRSLVRAIPFEPLSAFGGRPWHDRWTKTRVIKTRK